MEFRMDQNIVHPLRIHSDTLLELEEQVSLLLPLPWGSSLLLQARRPHGALDPIAT